jgi:6,7-dimethyl-8-ribityllumazine synthase
MAGHLPREVKDFKRIDGARIAIIGSMWHSHCVEGMMSRAHKELIGVGVKPGDISIHRIPGSLELPFAARILFESDPSLDAILAFGVILKGATSHDDTVMQQVVYGFAAVTDRFCKPVINEVIGVTDIRFAEERSGNSDINKGIEAVFAVSEILSWQRSVRRGE